MNETTIASITGLVDSMRAIRHDIHRHPELAYNERRTAALVAERLRSWGIEVHEHVGKTGVVGVIDAGGSSRTIGLRADMDALPITEATGLDYASAHPGTMHACGHDGHTAMLLGAAQHLAKTRHFKGRVCLIFQPAEEGQAGARAMIDDGLFQRFPCNEIYALHNWPSLPAGTIATRPGPMMAAADKFEIIINGTGGHAAQPQLADDTILCAAQIVTAAHTLVARRIDPAEIAVLSITKIAGGTSHNILPSQVTLTGTVRTFSPLVQDQLEAALRMVVENLATAAGCRASMEYSRYYPAVINDPACARHVLDISQSLFGNALLADAPAATSEDFAFMLREVPGAYVWLGQGSPQHSASLHDPRYNFNDNVLVTGAALLVGLVERRLA